MFMRRTVTRDYTMNGQDYRKGDKVVLFYGSANRDEAVFPDPEPLRHHPLAQPARRLRRAGPHFCLGAHLARREITRDVPRAAHPRPGHHARGEPDRLLSSFINGIKHLPCDFSR